MVRVYTTSATLGLNATLVDMLAVASMAQNGTRWLAASSVPRTPLEHAAAAIFALHTNGVAFDAATSGAEYWVKAHREESDDEYGPTGGGIHLHRDFDIGGESTAEQQYPNISTITYLTTARSMPTLVFTGLSLGHSLSASAAHDVWAVYPEAGKHVCFDGSLWHGVPPAAVFAPGEMAARRVGRAGTPRVTFLVNVWLDHVPRLAGDPKAGAEAFDAIELPRLDFAEHPQIEQWTQRHHPRAALWVRTPIGGTPDTAAEARGGDDVGDAEAGALALPLFVGSEACGAGFRLWLPSRLVSHGAARGAGASHVIFSGRGQPLDYHGHLGDSLRVDAPPHGGMPSALFCAARDGDAAAARLLVATGCFGAAAGETDGDGMTPLHLAARHGHAMVVGALLDGERTPIVPAREHGVWWRRLLRAARNPRRARRQRRRRRRLVSEVSSEGYAAVAHAARSGDAETVAELLKRGSAHHGRDKRGMTSLHVAADHGNAAAARVLLTGGAEADAREPRGATALHLAASHGDATTARTLIGGGASVDLVGAGVTALHLACSGGHAALARVLLDGGARVDATSSNGATALHLASYHGAHAIAALLLGAGADTASRDRKGNTPAMLATHRGHAELAQWLREAGEPAAG